MLRYAATASTARSATEAAGTALLLATVAAGGSSATGAALLALLTGSAALAGPVLGVVVDRSRRPARVFAGSIVTLGTAMALLAIALTQHWYAAAAVIAVLGGLGQPALTGAWSAQLPNLVAPAALPRAYAVDAATYNIGAVAGPGLAASLLALGEVGPLLGVAVVLAVALALLPTVHLPANPVRTAHDGVLTELVEGLRGLVATPALRSSTVVSTLGLAGQSALVVTAPTVSTRLTSGLGFTGWLLVAFAAGGLAASLALTVRPLRHPDPVVGLATLVVGTGLVVVGLAPDRWLALAGALVMGLGDGPMITAMFQVRTRDAPAQVRGKVFTTAASVRTLAYAAAAAGAGALLGPLGVSARGVLLVGAAVQPLAVLLGQLAARAGDRPGGAR